MIGAPHAWTDTRSIRGRKTALAISLAAVLLAAGRDPLRGFFQSRDALPELTQPVNDFAHVVDAESAAAIDRMSRALNAATGDSVVVATVQTVQPFADVDEMAVKLFENRGRGIGEKGKDNGLLILLALNERRVKIEVGYGLEQWITDGYAGETIRQAMTPEFRAGRYGAGLRAGAQRLIGRIAQARNVSLQGVPAPPPRAPAQTPTPFWVIFLIFLAILVISRIGGGPGRRRGFWGGGPWSGWSSGVGPFGGGWGGGGFGGGGFGGGFGGFGGGRSGGGGASGSW
jgi:uncharacterized protein